MTVPFWWIAAPFGLALAVERPPKGVPPSDGSRIGSDAIQFRILPRGHCGLLGEREIFIARCIFATPEWFMMSRWASGGYIPPWEGSLAAARTCSFHGSISSCHVGVDVILHSEADSIIHISTTR